MYNLKRQSLKPMAVLLALAMSGGAALAIDSSNRSESSFLDDASITAQIKAAMVKNDTIDALEIEVDTNGSEVVLSGTVETAAEKAEAERVALSVEGVTSVRNNIVVRSGG